MRAHSLGPGTRAAFLSCCVCLAIAAPVAACGGSGTTGLLGPGGSGGGGGLGAPGGEAGSTSGGSHAGGGDAPCSGLDCQRRDCGSGPKTTLTGRVYDPAGANPLYGVLVYIPSGPLTPLTKGATCDACGTITPSPLAKARTNAKGEFVLEDIPVTKSLPVVIQTGKWRRELVVDASQGCAENTVPDGQARLPKNGSEGDLPHFAVTTGGCDALECLLRGIGIDDSEFVPGASPSGHVHVFNGDGGMFPGAPAAGGSDTDPLGGHLWNWSAKMAPYDTILLSCECSEENATKGGNTPGARGALWDYASAGGRVIATHYHNTWLRNSPQDDWRQLASWTTGMGTGGASGVHDINTGFKEGADFADWLVATGASTTPGKVTLSDVTSSLTNVFPPARPWITAGSVPRFFSFATPTAGPACGEVAFSDVHMMGISAGGQPFPEACAAPGTLSPQQKALEFLLFQMSACKD